VLVSPPSSATRKRSVASRGRFGRSDGFLSDGPVIRRIGRVRARPAGVQGPCRARRRLRCGPVPSRARRTIRVPLSETLLERRGICSLGPISTSQLSVQLWGARLRGLVGIVLLAAARFFGTPREDWWCARTRWSFARFTTRVPHRRLRPYRRHWLSPLGSLPTVTLRFPERNHRAERRTRRVGGIAFLRQKGRSLLEWRLFARI
jgi:hypothetical protein